MKAILLFGLLLLVSSPAAAQFDRIEAICEAGGIDRPTLDSTLRRIAAGRELDFVASRTQLDDYAGIVRGPEGVLFCGGGNAWDRALLLRALLVARDPGLEVRFATAARTGPPATARTIHDRDRERDPDPTLLSSIAAEIESIERDVDTRSRSALGRIDEALPSGPDRPTSAGGPRVWLRIRRDGEWVDLDPEGVAPTPEAILTEPPADLLHTIEFEVRIESTGADGGSAEVVYSNRRPIAGLGGRLVTLSIGPEGEGLLEAEPADWKRFQPVVRWGEEVEYGRPFDLAGNSYRSRAGRFDPLQVGEGVEGLGRGLFGRARGAATRRRLARVSLRIVLDGPRGARSIERTWWAGPTDEAAAPGLVGTLRAWPIVGRPSTSTQLALALEPLRAGGLAEAVLAGDDASLARRVAPYPDRSLRMLLLACAPWADARWHLDRPGLLLDRTQLVGDDGRLRMTESLDIASIGGAPGSLSPAARRSFGVRLSRAEGAVLGDGARTAAGRLAGSRLRLVRPGDQVEGLPSAARDDLASGATLLVAEGALAWWRLEPGGEAVAVLPTGQGGAVIEMETLIPSHVLPMIENTLKYVFCLLGSARKRVDLEEANARCLYDFFWNYTKGQFMNLTASQVAGYLDWASLSEAALATGLDKGSDPLLGPVFGAGWDAIEGQKR